MPPGKTAQQHLEDLTWQGAHQKFPIRIDAEAEGDAAQGTRLIAETEIRALFSHRARHRSFCAQRKDSLSGQGVGGEFCGLLRARHHLGQSHRGRSVVRAFHFQGTARAARHRRRFRAFAPRGGDAVCLPAIWPPSRRDHRHRHSLPPALRDPRCRQGVRADRGRHRGAGRYGVGKLGQRPQRDAGQAGRARPAQSDDRACGANSQPN